MQKKIYKVTSVTHIILKTNPLTLVIDAKGDVFSSGWENGQLLPHVYIDPPADGIYGFDFVADEPIGVTLQMISEIESKPYEWQGFPDDLKGVRLHSTTNLLEEMI